MTMDIKKRTISIARNALPVLALAIGLNAATSAAQEVSLPGGANSLQEVHGDWVVTCAISGEGAQAAKSCSMSQEQQDGNSRQRIIAVEIQPSPEGDRATLVLPFGLSLAAGAKLQIDDGAPGQALSFRTCLPGGCIISTTFDEEMREALRSGAELKVHATADGGRETVFAISLRGFGGALNRTAELAG
ncbi:invasion associated locus B family protein [Pelagibacterium sp. H642]|uniref:invasion associated locus B family protein n=1 Tax=Pelagibacterium sp. H642 TaxID=1881069 RepID=UPI0028154F04|nr:invasion associated locus B family protein [Pelagibacterium sp. H642]WMT91977.1 invasion associated locus B family protein [Pelagibacterium sp. H642]